MLQVIHMRHGEHAVLATDISFVVSAVKSDIAMGMLRKFPQREWSTSGSFRAIAMSN